MLNVRSCRNEGFDDQFLRAAFAWSSRADAYRVLERFVALVAVVIVVVVAIEVIRNRNFHRSCAADVVCNSWKVPGALFGLEVQKQ